MPHRKAASVLPDPVGAEMRTYSPEAIAGHACSWASVGAANAASNQSRTAGENWSSGIVLRVRRAATAGLSVSDASARRPAGLDVLERRGGGGGPRGGAPATSGGGSPRRPRRASPP